MVHDVNPGAMDPELRHVEKELMPKSFDVFAFWCLKRLNSKQPKQVAIPGQGLVL